MVTLIQLLCTYSPLFLIFVVQREKNPMIVIMKLPYIWFFDTWLCFYYSMSKIGKHELDQCSKRISIRPNFNHVCGMKIQNLLLQGCSCPILSVFDWLLIFRQFFFFRFKMVSNCILIKPHTYNYYASFNMITMNNQFFIKKQN